MPNLVTALTGSGSTCVSAGCLGGYSETVCCLFLHAHHFQYHVAAAANGLSPSPWQGAAARSGAVDTGGAHDVENPTRL
eukprot:3654233-Alexandrium_andersonii.AAC.1